VSDKSASPIVVAPKTSRPAFYALATAALLVTILSRAQAIVVPVALAAVLSFALGPAVKRIERKVGRVVAVLVVVLVAVGTVTGFGFVLERQLVDLSTQMTKYSDSISRKVRALRATRIRASRDCRRASTGWSGRWINRAPSTRALDPCT